MINLSNYEEYFLLYIDNELSKEQSKAVEQFVLQHSHLAAELNMLQDAKLPAAEPVLFTDKSFLYRTAGSSINITNYEEYFLLHTDRELSAAQEEEVEQFVLQHPQLQNEFLLLQQAKLIPENLECPDKNRLYKQPGKRIIPLYITRMAVAAAVAGVIVLAGSLVIYNKDKQPQVAATVNKSINPKQAQSADTVTLPNKKPEVDFSEDISSNNTIVSIKVKQVKQKPATSSKNNDKETVLPVEKESNEQLVVAQINRASLSNITHSADSGKCGSKDRCTLNKKSPMY